LALDPNFVDAHYNLGVTYYDKGDMNLAIREFREAKRLNPKDIAVRMNLGSASVARLGAAGWTAPEPDATPTGHVDAGVAQVGERVIRDV